MVQGVHPSFQKWYADKTPDKILGKEASELLKNFGFKGVRVVTVEQGIKGIAIQSVIKELKDQSATPINQQIAEILGLPESAIDSILVIVGGLELVKSKMKEIEKSLKKIDQKRIGQLAKQLGIENADDVLILAEGKHQEIGGLIFVQAGMREIEESVQ